jgi:hypothetical protein
MKHILILLFIGMLAGGMSGFLGIGGGIIVIPLLVLLLGFSQQSAQGTSLGLLLPPIGLLAVINYYKAGFVDLKAAFIMAIAFLVGSYVASKFATVVPEYIVKKSFAVFLLFYSIKLFIEK